MNPVLQTAANGLADVMPENATISPPSADHSATFSLPPSAGSPLAERARSAKISQQSSSEAQRPPDSDPAAMQALMALLLAQPAHSAAQSGLQRQPEGEMLKTLAATQGGNSFSSVLRQRVSDAQSRGQNVMPSAPQSADMSSLPSEWQSALQALAPDASPVPATPEQQATLATFAAQNLRSIAPERQTLSASQHISAQAKRTGSDLSVRPPGVKKTDSVNLNQPGAAQNLLNVAVQGNQPVNAASQQPAISSHSALPVAMSTEELGEKLSALLKDRIQFQLNQQQQVSTIRLDPPSLGKLEIAIQLDAGKLMVHIGANQSDVCRSLQQFSENLRQYLTAQNFMEVNVQVSSEGQSQQQQQSGHQQDEVKSALSLNDEPQYQQNESVLIKV
ncbi:flagellar hook-length control protein FliK [Citrobacter amalonaticus]|uniref:Flagellar hook-length control protein FliK n=1 Tax=Citrobacter amalonaticus TaxID=35703 RepID=A0A2S4RRY5_CITAM|nr:flagellar hook-length control protein FliK [Citrobacter amalonaticus]POT58642.1 flagellar hook-length control protein FliK [Citrobacter amalonaticus]POT70380.1 flagellar hook-length control protein FliK [Citrobacter amalonaticus]POU61364.1 flagellar hook-length control protein FliK [Citrobacter amalonaticus]POV05068.1 flagellar hook-length control protein FliK [Citrobacter amalonaticus]